MHIDHDHIGGGHHHHEHTHDHTHEHTHDGTAHTHAHSHAHDHDHTHPHTHEHLHDHDHRHDHCHSDCCSCGSQCSHTPMEELMALMKYMVSHNTAHANELAELAKQFEAAGNTMAYRQVMSAVSDFEKGNMRLSLVLNSLEN